MTSEKTFRALRITTSAVFGLFCVLLVVLWVRSYWRVDSLSIAKVPLADSIRGRVNLGGSIAVNSDGPLKLQRLLLFGGRIQIISFAIPPHEFSLFPHGRNVKVPYWFAIFAFAFVGCTPWIPWPKRFTLRTLLIATTLIAFVLGAVVYSLR
jgi:hypothetical protein